MQRLFMVIVLAGSIWVTGHAQDRFYTKSGKIQFYSKAELEDIEANNKTVGALLDAKTGSLQFSVLMKSFEFEKALMQEHFNSDYVESDKYPKAEFTGTIQNNSAINYKKDGTYPAEVTGQITIHNVTRTIKTLGSIKIENGKPETTASFPINLSDYNIKIPSIVKGKISNSIRITVDCKMETYP